MIRRLVILGALACIAPALAGCGDACKSGYVDTFGFCSPDGFDFQRADGTVTAIVDLAATYGDNETGSCNGGGDVTISGSSSCPAGGVCTGDHTYTFGDCTMRFPDLNGLEMHFTTGSLRDQSTSAVSNGTMTFVHQIRGDVTFSGTVQVKTHDRSFVPQDCAMDFTHTEQLLKTPVISGTMCGDEIVQPLYE